MNRLEQEELFLKRYPDLVKHLVINDLVEVENPLISVTARSKELYFNHLFPDCSDMNEFHKKIKNREILDIGCGYNPIYDESLIQHIVKNKKLNAKITGMDIINMKMPNYINKSVYNFNKKCDLILINNFLYFWVNDPKKLLQIYKNLHKNLNTCGQVRIFPCYMDNYHMNDEKLKKYLNENFAIRMIKPKYYAEDPFYQDKESDEIIVLTGLGIKEKKINYMLNSHTLILKKM